MAASTPFKIPSLVTANQNPSKQSNLLCKFSFIIFILLIPFIPSQAPEFITQSVFTKLWELFHLLFVGLAICYGLFSKRSSDDSVEFENHSNNDVSDVGFSGILEISSFFEDGFGNSCGYDEKRLILSSNKHKSLLSKHEILNSCDSGGESMLVVDESGNPVSEFDDKPLNLPIRSLRSRIKESVEKSDESEVKVEVRKFRGMVPINLEKKFNKVAEPSPIPWRSRSGRIEMREEISKANNKPARPHSVEEFSHSLSSVTSSESSSVSGLSFADSKSQIHEYGSSKEMRMQRSDKENLFESGKSIGDQKWRFFDSDNAKVLSRGKSLGSENPRWSFFDSPGKSPYPVKGLSRGKSVRTIRTSKDVLDEMKMEVNNSEFVDDNAGKLIEEFEKPEGSSKMPILETPPSGTHQLRSNEEAGSELEGSEVDRKAAEFIAKFREQIKLQKLESIKRYRG